VTRERSPFDRWDLDPRSTPAEITARLRELAEDASPEEREEIRAAWEALTMHPRRRFEAALDSHPETREPLGAPPAVRAAPSASEPPLDLPDLIPRPRLEAALPPPTAAERAMLGPPPADRALSRQR
jgi:hypothetical protein